MWEPTQEEIDQLKQMNNVTGAKHDGFYRAVTPILFDVAKDHCNGKWEPSEMPQGVRLFIAKAIQFNTQSTGLKGRVMGTVSYSYDNEFPKAIWVYYVSTSSVYTYKFNRFCSWCCINHHLFTFNKHLIDFDKLASCYIFDFWIGCRAIKFNK